MAEGLRILCWDFSAKRIVRPVAIESMGQSVDEALQFVDAISEVAGGIELVSTGRLGALDAAIVRKLSRTRALR